MVQVDDILKFWLDDCDLSDWYNSSDALDAEIIQKFEPAWQAAANGAFGLWLTYPSGTLAYLILTDQFPRNMYRGQSRAFETDRLALAAAKKAIRQGWDLKIAEPARQFFYIPLMHSECLRDQDRCVRLMGERMGGDLIHARVHREIIRLFGRFPYRNDALGRKTTQEEQAFLDGPGYGGLMQSLKLQACA